MNTGSVRNSPKRRLRRRTVAGLTAAWLFCLLLPASLVAAEASETIQSSPKQATSITVNQPSAFPASGSHAPLSEDQQIEVRETRPGTLSAQDLSLFGILALGIIGLLWVRRHTSEL